MWNVRAAAIFASSVTVLGTLATGVTPAHAAARTGYTLYVSTHANRSHAAKLSHHAVHGKVYVYALPGAGALRVKFYIDDPNRRHAPIHIERSAPYDLLGGSVSRPNAYNTNQLRNGKHTLTIQVDMPLKRTFRSTTSFIVRNVPPKPTHVHAYAGHGQVKVTWHAGARHSGEASTVGYYVYRSTHSKVRLAHPLGGKMLKANKRSFFDYTVKTGSRYYYVVVAVGGKSGRSAAPTVRSARVKSPPPLSLGSVTATGGNGRVSLSWSARGATSIRVYRSTSATVNLKSKPIYSHTVTSASGFTDTKVTNGTTYRYVVQAVVGIRHATSHTLTAVPVAPPASVTAVGGPTGVAVAWTTTSTKGVNGFNIYRSTSPDVPLTSPIHVAQPGDTSWPDTSAAIGTTYYYVVEAESLHGMASTPGPIGGATAVAAPSPSASATDSDVTLTWTPNGVGVTGYEVRREGVLIASRDSSVGTFTDTGRTADTTYHYTVRALAAGGHADGSVTITTDITAPVVTSSTNSHGVVGLSWTASNEPPVTSYRIYRGVGSASPSGAVYDTVSSGTHSWSDTGTGLGSDGGTTYAYIVQAFWAGGHANSNMVTETPEPNLPGAVDLQVEAGEGDSVDLSWTAADDLTQSLTVYLSDTAGDIGDPLVPTLEPSATSATNTPEHAGTWYYTVRSANGAGHTDSEQESVEVDGP